MKTDVIIVNSTDLALQNALKLAEKTAAYKELSSKNALHLRLLTEELMSMMRSIANDMEGRFWIEDENGVYSLNLVADASMSAKKREQLISASTSGQNEANRGIMGKIRSFFETDEDCPVLFNMYYTDDAGDAFQSNLCWSLDMYRDEVMRSVKENKEGAKEAWDELEKSVVSRVADDVRVSIRGREISMVIVKKMD